MADWFETRFREHVGPGQPDAAFVARMRALVVEEWHAGERTIAPQEIDAHDREGDLIMLESDDHPMDHEPVATRRRSPRRRLLVAAAAIVVVVAAASIASRGKDPVRFATTTPTTSRATTTSELYESVVAEHSGAILEWIDSEESCDHLECSFNRYLRERYLPFGQLLTDLDRTLAELPSPPDEIATLVDGTKARVADTLSSVDLLLACTAASAPCDDERSAAQAAYEELRPLFEAWGASV